MLCRLNHLRDTGSYFSLLLTCLQCFDSVGWAAGRASGLKKTEWWVAGVVICLERGADLHMVLAHDPVKFASSTSGDCGYKAAVSPKQIDIVY